MSIGSNAAVAAIQFALKADEGLEFLRCWIQGDFSDIRKEWPEAPQSVFAGADPLHSVAAGPEGNILVAHLTVDGETMTVKAEEVHHALYAWVGRRISGQQINAKVRIDVMKASEFTALPEWQ